MTSNIKLKIKLKMIVFIIIVYYNTSFLFLVYVCLPAWVYMCHMYAWGHEGQKRASGFLELQPQSGGNCHMGAGNQT